MNKNFKKIINKIMKQKKLMLLSLVMVAGLIYYFKPYNHLVEHFLIKQYDYGLEQKIYSGNHTDFESLEKQIPKNKNIITDLKTVKYTPLTSYIYTGFITIPPLPGTQNVTFELTSNDSSYLYFNNELIIDNSGVNHTTSPKTKTVQLEEGISYPIKIYYSNSSDNEGNLLFRWKSDAKNDIDFKSEMAGLYSVVITYVDITAQSKEKEEQQIQQTETKPETTSEIKPQNNNSNMTLWIIIILLTILLVGGGIAFFLKNNNNQMMVRV